MDLQGSLSHPVSKFVCMESAPASGLLDPSVGVGCGTAGSVCVGRVDEKGLSDDALRSHLKVLGRAESRLTAMRSRALAELSRRHSTADAQRMVRDELQASKREAKRDVETAARLAELPATSEALESGEIPQGHARLIARASSESPIDEELLVEAAGTESFDEFARTVKRHQQDRADDDGQALLDRQRSNRKARIFESSESGMFVLTGEFDQITGARIATALTAKERQLWHREDPKARATPQQRMADALAELICEPASGRSAGTDLLVIADFDVLKQQLDNPRLADGSPIPIVELHRLALEANLLPSIFDTKAQDMWLGRRQRTASEAQRVALIARDQHCIGCGANPLWCRAHHIIWWSKNGPTDLENLALVCDDCHHKIHDDGWQVNRDPDTGKFHLKPPNPTNAADPVEPGTPTETGQSNQHSGRSQPGYPNRDRARATRPTQRAPSTRTTRNGRPKPGNPTDSAGTVNPNNPKRATRPTQRAPSTRTTRNGRPKPGNPTDSAGTVKKSNPDRATRPTKQASRRGTQTGRLTPGNPADTGDANPPKQKNPTNPEPQHRRRAGPLAGGGASNDLDTS